MFTGLIENTGRVVSVSGSSGGISVIAIESAEIANEMVPGESIAVSGACLTVIETRSGVFRAQMMEETLKVTNLGRVGPGGYVNLERALKLGARLDGHFVLGHVDEVGEVKRVEPDGNAKKIWISASDKISWGIAPKGSIAVDGVSLTVIDSEDDCFSIGLIPATLRETTLGRLKRGDGANIEIDVVARYIARLAGLGKKSGRESNGGLTWEKLIQYGWN